MARVKRGVTSKAKHKKVLKAVRVNGVEEKIPLELLSKLWKNPCNTLTETEEIKKEILNHCGYRESMLE